MSSCISDDFASSNQSDTRENDFFLFIKVPDNVVSETRALSEADNYKLDLSKLRILLFKDSKFFQEVPVDEIGSSYDDTTKAYKIKINDIERNNDLVDFVVVANNDFVSPAVGTTKSDFKNQLTFDIKGKWDTSAPRYLPFWGGVEGVKLDENLGTKYNPKKFEISLLRAVARIDFISAQTSSSIDPAASALKIKSISVYNSYDKGAIIPKDLAYNNETNEVILTTIPSGVKYNKGSGNSSDTPNTDPLKYELTNDYEFLSEIFLPEQELSSLDKDKRLTFIIGGQQEGATTTTYYRVDLHEFDDTHGYVPLDVLRNHRYIFNILGVRGLGTATEEQALKSNSHNLDVDLVFWDEAINEGFIFGDRYFGINSSALYFPEHTKGQELIVPIQTNLDVDEIGQKVVMSWGTPGLFKSEVITEDDVLKIKVTTLTDNFGTELLSDVLTLHINSHTFKVDVSQNTQKLDYDILCESISVKGVYQKSIPLNTTNYITVKLRSEIDHTGYRYEVKTDKIDNISFYTQGTFNMTKGNDGLFYQTVILYGNGIPRSTVTKYMTLIPNSKRYQTCSAEIKMAYSPKRIVGVGTEFYGYSTGGTESHSHRFRTSTNNFGLKEESIIKSAPLSDELFKNQTNAATSSNLETFRENMSTDPDILIWGYTGQDNSRYTQEMTTIAVDYLKRGGTMIYMSETLGAIQDFFDKLYAGKGVQLEAVTSGSAGTNYPFITQPGDLITDGPFGNVHGRFWGEDASYTRAIRGVPEEDIVIYSLAIPAGREDSTEDRGYCIFRHTKYNLFFIGDAGFISQSGAAGDMRSSTICPFLVDDNDRPIPKPNYGRGSGTRRGAVYNAPFFANVLAWAIDRAEFFGINSDK